MLRHTYKLALLGATSILLFASIPAAAKCDLDERNLGDCLLSEFTAEAVVVVREPRYRLRLPNLRVRDVDVSANGVISVEVENDGLAASPAFDVLVGADRSPGTGDPGQNFEMVVPFPALESGDRYEMPVGSLNIPDNDRNWDIYVAVFVDMMNRHSPGGQVWEANEEDNILVYECRLLGSPPDYSGPRPC